MAPRWGRLLLGLVLAAGGLLPAGCVHTKHAVDGPPAVYVPPPGAVPRELDKVTLPEYVIEPPDALRIEAVIIVPQEEATEEWDAEQQRRQKANLEPQTTPRPTGDVLRSLPLQPVWGEYPVRPDGTVYLGVYGSVPVAGYTLRQAASAIRETLARQVFPEAGGVRPERILVVLDVTQYNSKNYYVITDGGGNGEQVLKFPVTGSETVLDAMSNVGGLSPVSSKRNIWVARRCPVPDQPDQILPVDWVGITQYGVTLTNYQLMPGDRVYVKAERLVTLDTRLARIISPVERIFGVTLLGSTTVNQIKGRGFGFGDGN